MADIQVFCPIAKYPSVGWLKPKSYDYQEIDPTYRPPGIAHATYFGYPVLPVVTRPINGYVSGRVMLPHLERFRPDVVLAYWLYPEGYGAVRAAQKLGIPSVVCARGSDLRAISNRAVERLTRDCVQKASFVLTVSEELRQQAIRFGARPQHSATILNGCDGAVFHPGDRAAARLALDVASNAELIVFVGHLIATKGVRELLQAVASLAASRPFLQVVFIGEGALREELQKMAADAGLAERIRFTGACTGPQIAQWMAAANVFSLPSYSEGCPNVVIEALSCDRPVVSTTVGGIPELVNAECGVLVPPKEVGPLVRALTEALDRTWLPESISNRFQRSWERVAEETLDICSRVVAEAHLRRQGSGRG